jgi:uroporphyrinogen-III synthase
MKSDLCCIWFSSPQETPALLTPSTHLPLYGRRILVTAPRSYASRLSQHLIVQGGLPLLMPTIETCFLDHHAELDAVLKQVDQFDWIAFTSRNGIDAFFQRFNYLGLSPSLLQHCRICAIGKDASRLPTFGLRTDLLPTEASPMGIVAALARIPQIAQKRVLVPIPKVVGIPEPNVIPNFLAGLRQLGMDVMPVPTYLTRCLNKAVYRVELDLLRRGQVDAIAFSSTAEVEGFLSLVGSSSRVYSCPIACFGPYTAANARALGLSVSIVADDFSSFAGFAEAIADFFAAEMPYEVSG